METFQYVIAGAILLLIAGIIIGRYIIDLNERLEGAKNSLKSAERDRDRLSNTLHSNNDAALKNTKELTAIIKAQKNKSMYLQYILKTLSKKWNTCLIVHTGDVGNPALRLSYSTELEKYTVKSYVKNEDVENKIDFVIEHIGNLSVIIEALERGHIDFVPELVSTEQYNKL